MSTRVTMTTRFAWAIVFSILTIVTTISMVCIVAIADI